MRENTLLSYYPNQKMTTIYFLIFRLVFGQKTVDCLKIVSLGDSHLVSGRACPLRTQKMNNRG